MPVNADDPMILRAIVLYAPILFCGLAGMRCVFDRRRKAAAVISTGVTAVGVLGVNALAVEMGWWNFAPGPGSMGVPVEVLVGWSALWGLLPAFLLPRAPRLRHGLMIVVGAVGVDLAAMPLLEPLIVLNPRWLIGEALAVLLILIPSVTISILTLQQRHVVVRGGIQAAAVAVGFILIPPALSAAGGGPGLSALTEQSLVVIVATMILGAPGAFMALWAFGVFLFVGRGTPVPLDPPQHLVTSGPYAYIANPMQTGSLILLAAYGIMLGSWQILVGLLTIVTFFSAIAAAIERDDLLELFGDEWVAWRRVVRRWVPKLPR